MIKASYWLSQLLFSHGPDSPAQGRYHPLRQLAIGGVGSSIEIPSPLVWLSFCQVDKSHYDIILPNTWKPLSFDYSHHLQGQNVFLRLLYFTVILISFYELGITDK